jgi:gluconokinase
MSRGEALTDADRWPWLDRVADEMGTTRLAVATCSALKQAYRDVLRRVAGVRFVYLDIDETTALARLRSRPDHFMGPDMVAGQFAALERPALDEDDVIRVDATADAGPIVESILDWLIRAPGTG